LPYHLHLKTELCQWGCRRLVAAFKAKNIQIGHYKSAPSNATGAYKTCMKKHIYLTTDSQHALPIADNLLSRPIIADP
jgi:hypothetical protein